MAICPVPFEVFIDMPWLRESVTSYGDVAKLPIRDAVLLKYIYCLELHIICVLDNKNKTKKENLTYTLILSKILYVVILFNYLEITLKGFVNIKRSVIKKLLL